jgi:hypothetical protein
MHTPIMRRFCQSAVAAIISLLVPFDVLPALASTPNHVMLRLDRIQSSTTTGGSVCVIPNNTYH